MTANGARSTTALADGAVARVLLYYVALALVGAAAWRWLPASLVSGGMPGAVADFGRIAAGGAPAAVRPAGASVVAVGTAMLGAVLLALPVALVYVRTRAVRGYQQSVVQTLVILPVVVAGVVVLVKDSLALAFGLAGIVAAVRFRTALDDSKDAVHVFLAVALGLAAAVDLPAAAVMSALFNVVVLLLWAADFGRTPAHLDGRAADRRMRRAMEQLSRTGTFVARMDDEVFQDMTAEQLNAVADRAWRRARRNNPEQPDREGRRESLLRVRTADVAGVRRTVEPALDARTKRWRYGGVVHEPDGTHVVEYVVLLRREDEPDALPAAVRAAGGSHVAAAELAALLLAALLLLPLGAPLRAQDPAGDPAADSARRAERAREDEAAAARFYADTAPLRLTLVANLGRLRGDRRDGAPWRDAALRWTDDSGGTGELAIRARTRGIWRLANCHFPPLRLDLPRGAGRATPLAGIDRPKLVTHCRDDDRADEYVLQELQLYRIHALLTPLAHRVRLLRVTYVDSASGRPATERWAILLEEPEALAARNGGRLIEAQGATPQDLDPATSTVAAVFQYLVGNTDWSIGALHNAELVATDGLLHAVPYDFDHAGAVDAFYARPPQQLGIRSVRQRVFRGFCVPEAEFERAFALFRERRAAIRALYADGIGRLLQPRTVERTLEYFADFDRTIDDPGLARRRIVEACRGPNDG